MRINRVKFITAIARAEITQKELSARTGISTVTISAVKGGKKCSTSTAQRLAEGLAVPLESILEDTGRVC